MGQGIPKHWVSIQPHLKNPVISISRAVWLSELIDVMVESHILKKPGPTYIRYLSQLPGHPLASQAFADNRAILASRGMLCPFQTWNVLYRCCPHFLPNAAALGDGLPKLS